MPEPEQPAKAIESANDGPADDGKPAPARATLLSLPDELLRQIFNQVHAMYMHKKRNMPPTSYLCLNKRLSMLAQPIWLSVLCAPQDKIKAERSFLGMIGMQDRLLHVRELEWTVHKAYPAYRLALVKSLRNLTTLHMRAINPVADSVEGTVWSTIASLDKLKEVAFLWPRTPLQHSYYPWVSTRRLECTPSDLKGDSIIFSELIGFDWRGDGSTDVLHEVPEGLLDYLWVPNLHFFLEVLRQSTEVLELRLRSDEDINTPEYRWTRLTSEDDFEVESYDLA